MSDKLKILITSWNAGYQKITAGGYVRTLEILKRVPKDIELIIVDTQPGVYQSIQQENVKHIIYSIPRWIKYFENKSWSFNLERVLEWFVASCKIFWIAFRERKNYDLVYNPYSELLVTSLACLKIKWLLRKKVVMMNLNATPIKSIELINAFIHNQIKNILTISQALKNDLEKQNIHPLEINYTGIDLDPINQVEDQDKSYDAVFIGRHTEEKGIPDLLEVTRMIKEQKPDFKLITIGSIEPIMQEFVDRKLKSYQIVENFRLAGIVSDQEKFKIIKGAKICLFLSYREGWGIAPQEALACGLPVITYHLPVYEEHLVKCPAVFLVPIGDQEKAARKAVEILNQFEEKDELWSRQGKEFVKNYGWDKIARAEFNLLEDFVNN